MTDYQKERINRQMRNECESYRRHADALADPLLSDEGEANRHSNAMNEAWARINGMREVLEMLGYSIRYENHSLPQVV